MKYFPENTEYHNERMEEIYTKIVEAVKVILPQTEVKAADEDYLVGLLILYDSYLNIKFEFSAKRTQQMIDLFFLSSGIKKQKLRDLVWDACERSISAAKKFDEIKNQIEVTELKTNFAEGTLTKIVKAKADLTEELKVREKLNEDRDRNRHEVILLLMDAISMHTIEVKHDNSLLILIERWVRFYKDEEAELLKLSNFLTNRLLEMQSNARLKAMNLLHKVLDMRTKLNDCSKGSHFLSSKEEYQQSDVINTLLQAQGKDFVKGLIEIIMYDLGIKEDTNLITSGGRSKTTIKTTVRRGKNKRTVTRIVSNNITRYFKTFHSLFKFYGVPIFKDIFLPVLKGYIDSKFEGKDHPNIWKLIFFDIISAFWRTCNIYYDQDPELFDECPFILYKLYDSKSKSDIKSLFRDSMLE